MTLQETISSVFGMPLSWAAIVIQALGGLLAIYVIFAIIRFFMLRKQNKMIKEMHDDIKSIKNKLNKRK